MFWKKNEQSFRKFLTFRCNKKCVFSLSFFFETIIEQRTRNSSLGHSVLKLKASVSLHKWVSSSIYPWSSLEVGDEGCIGRRRKLLCFCQSPKKYVMHAWQNSIVVWLLGQFSCLSPSTKELTDLPPVSPQATDKKVSRLSVWVLVRD